MAFCHACRKVHKLIDWIKVNEWKGSKLTDWLVNQLLNE